ncbi:MAG: glycine cleavage system protein H [Rhizobacter sp.]|nr:glycine cleavage system protein H [Rhizobacter sp.]
MNLHELSFPADLYYLVEHDVWARLEDDGTATVGITSLGIKLSGEIYMCRAKPVGAVIEQGRAVAVVELAKAIVSVKSAVSGTVLALNPRLDDAPQLVHTDPYGEGWIARLALADFERDRAQLVRGEGVLSLMARHAEAFRELP